MNLWDSVQRGLEKASQEASRIARIQRLRSTTDGLSRQINTQQGALINRAMELFANGRLAQGELVSLCQELANLQQQLTQAQNELKQLQSQNTSTATPGTTTIPYPASSEATAYAAPPPPPPSAAGEVTPTIYAPPPPGYQGYMDMLSTSAPPPPPGVEPLTISALDTVLMPGSTPPAPNIEQETIAVSSETPQSEKKLYCQSCSTEVIPGNAYCHNCGMPVQTNMASYLPTARGSAFDALLNPADSPQTPFPLESQGTIRADQPISETKANEGGA